MTRHARALFFAALAVALGPLVMPDGADARDVRSTPAVAPVPVEQGAYPVSHTPRSVLPALPVDRHPELSGPPGPSAATARSAEWSPAPVIASCGVAYAPLPGAAVLRPFHRPRAPPRLS